MASTAGSLIRSTHPGPSLAVTAIAVILGIGAGLEPWRLVLLGLAMLADQFSVGLSNDWLDAGRDRAVGRADKPVALGLVGERTARAAAFGCAGAAVLLTIPLGWPAAVVHLLAIGSAWSYNAGLKATAFSVLPYLVSFGLLPAIATLARPEPAFAASWALAAGGLLGVSGHFSNVLPDLDADRATGVRGLPHRVGQRVAGLIIAGALAAASGLVVFGPGRPPSALTLTGLGLSLAIAAACVVLVLTKRVTRLLFLLIIVGAIINVVLLALAGDRLLA